jgi:hypothetical protein
MEGRWRRKEEKRGEKRGRGAQRELGEGMGRGMEGGRERRTRGTHFCFTLLYLVSQQYFYEKVIFILDQVTLKLLV